ncbi:unnamed protein product [Calypogeia fissa]
MEAFMGTHIVDGGSEAALAFMQRVGISVYFDDGRIAEASTRCDGDTRVVKGKNLSELEKDLGYSFQNKSILVEALTHPSLQAPFGNYQRLETLGDAVLGYLITRYLYETFADIPPGSLTDLKSLTASNESFADVAVRKDMQKFLLYKDKQLAEQIKKFVQSMNGKKQFYGWGSYKTPKVLGDLLESLAGAVLVDTGFDTNKVWDVFEPLLQPIVTPKKLQLHPVKELGELCDKKKITYKYFPSSKGTQRLGMYKVIIRKETIVAKAEKPDKTSAQRRAAYKMLRKLKKLGLQHPRHDLTAALISQGTMEPLAHVREQEVGPDILPGILQENFQDSLQEALQETVSGSSSEGDQEENAEMHSVSSSVAGLEMLKLSSSASSGSLETLTTSSTLKSVGAEQEAQSVEGGKGFLDGEHTVPSSSRETKISGLSTHSNSLVDENVGRPRADLHNLCAKYGWTMPKYEPCPGYPQGPSHEPRFAFSVSISCWLTKPGSTFDYDVLPIKCEGDPMNNKPRAMDSAAACAIALLQENFESGRTLVPAKYFR